MKDEIRIGIDPGLEHLADEAESLGLHDQHAIARDMIGIIVRRQIIPTFAERFPSSVDETVDAVMRLRDRLPGCTTAG